MGTVRSPLKVLSLLLALFIGVPVCLLLGLWVWVRWANDVPPYPIPADRLPNPNGYERAEQLAYQLPGGRGEISPGDHPRLLPHLAKARPILDGVRATFRLEWDEPRDWDAYGVDGRFHPFTACAEYFVAESEAARRRGDRGAALVRRLDALELGSLWTHGGLSLTGSSALSCLESGGRGIEPLLRDLSPSVNSASLARVRRFQHAWKAYPDALNETRLFTLYCGAFWLRVPEERFDTPRSLKWLTMSAVSGSPDARARLNKWLIPKRIALRNLDRYYRRRVAECRKPFSLRRTVPMPGIVESLYPGLESDEGEAKWWAAQTLLALLEVALVVEQYRGTHGRYPPRLDAIPRRWLPAVPKDPWEQPICYRLKAGRPVIYSRGPDGVDSGGDQIAVIEGLDLRAQGDLVFGRLWSEQQPMATGR